MKKRNSTERPLQKSPSEPKKFIPPKDILDDTLEFNLLENVYLQGYEEYLRTYKDYSSKTCLEYFKLKVRGAFRHIESQINTVPLNLRREACALMFRGLKYQIKVLKTLGNKYQSSKVIAKRGNGQVNLNSYKEFLTQQERAFALMLRVAPEKEKELDLTIDVDIFNEKFEGQASKRETVKKPVTSFVWKTKNEIQIREFYNFIKEANWIDEIPFTIFQNHLFGFPQAEFINWREKAYYLPVFLDGLSQFIEPQFYRKNGSCSPSMAAKHFTLATKEITPANFSNWKKQRPPVNVLQKFEGEVKILTNKLRAIDHR